MKNTISIILILLVGGCHNPEKVACNYITDYYPLIYQADLAYELQDYEKAFDLYSEAFNSCEPKNTQIYYELNKFTETAAILQKFDVAYIYAVKQIENGVVIDKIQKNSNYNDFLASDSGIKFLVEYDSLREAYLQNADFALRDEIISMVMADQMYRVGDSNIPKQDSVDELHAKKLIEIFENSGYPTNKMVGPLSFDNRVDVGLLLLHTRDSIRINYFIPKMKEFVRNGTAPPWALGTIIDQYYLYNGEPQINGTYGEKKNYDYMIPDREQVDENRISIGLPPLALKEKRDSLIHIKYGI